MFVHFLENNCGHARLQRFIRRGEKANSMQFKEGRLNNEVFPMTARLREHMNASYFESYDPTSNVFEHYCHQIILPVH